MDGPTGSPETGGNDWANGVGTGAVNVGWTERGVDGLDLECVSDIQDI